VFQSVPLRNEAARTFVPVGYRSYINRMAITYDPEKRERNLRERGLDFADAKYVFQAPHLEVADLREDYGEDRIICYGRLTDRLVVVGYVQRGQDQHVFSMRKANEREQARYGPKVGL
jgi:uncharacterized protein